MKVASFLTCLKALPAARYLGEVRRTGLANLDPTTRAWAVELYRQARGLRGQEQALSKDLRQTPAFVERALAPEWVLARRGDVTYPSYAHVGLLQWALGADQQPAHDAARAGCWKIFRILLDDLLAFEQGALAGAGRRREHFRCDVVGRRMELLKALADKVGLVPGDGARPEARGPQHDWPAYAPPQDCGPALRDWTALPLTLEHDETFVLRTVHLSECCWWGARMALIAALEHGKRCAPDRAAEELMHAAAFAEVLLAVAFVFKKTAPAVHSQSARLAADKAATGQSRTFRRLNLLLEGSSEASHQWHLRRLLRQVRLEQSPGAAALRDAAAVLDRAFHGWRQLQGGTAGAGRQGTLRSA